MKIRSVVPAILVLLFATAGTASADVDGDLDSSRRFDQVTFLVTHNAFSSTEDGWLYAQQNVSIKNQLAYGVRGLMLDIWTSRGGVVENQCRDVEKSVDVVEDVCKTVTQPDCKDVTKTRDQCRDVSEKSCSWAPWPVNEACKMVTRTVCEPVSYVEKVCTDVSSVVCAPATVTKMVTEKVCDVASLVPGGEKRVRLCHEMKDSECLLTRTVLHPLQGPRTLASSLEEVKDFLDRDTDAIVTIFFESNIDDSGMLDREFREAGIDSYVFDVDDWFKDSARQWPTLKEMRDSNKRLVVFSSNAAGDGRADNWKYTVETKYNLAEDAKCGIRSSTSDYKSKPTVHLLTMNHFFEIAIGQPYLPSMAPETTNNAPALLARAALCKAETGFLPNFIALDFAERGTGLAAVKSLNAMPR